MYLKVTSFDQEKKQKMIAARPETIIEELITQINVLSDDKNDKEVKKQFLLIVDNAEDIIEHSGSQFKALTA